MEFLVAVCRQEIKNYNDSETTKRYKYLKTR